MKKLIALIVVLVFLVPSALFAQDQSVAGVNGHAWIEWIAPQKLTFVQGFMVANQALIYAVWSTPTFGTNDDKEFISEYLMIPEPVQVVAQRIDMFYLTTGQLDIPVWSVIYMIYQKDWWRETDLAPEPSTADPEPSLEKPREPITPNRAPAPLIPPPGYNPVEDRAVAQN